MHQCRRYFRREFNQFDGCCTPYTAPDAYFHFDCSRRFSDDLLVRAKRGKLHSVRKLDRAFTDERKPDRDASGRRNVYLFSHLRQRARYIGGDCGYIRCCGPTGGSHPDAGSHFHHRRQFDHHHLVFGQRDELQGIGKLERHAGDQRHSDGKADRCGDRYLYLDMLKCRGVIGAKLSQIDRHRAELRRRGSRCADAARSRRYLGRTDSSFGSARATLAAWNS